jgi:DNA-binding NarL/FixJ family response regulator
MPMRLTLISNRPLFRRLPLADDAAAAGCAVVYLPLDLSILDEGAAAIVPATVALIDVSAEPDRAALLCEGVRLCRLDLRLGAVVSGPGVLTASAARALLEARVDGFAGARLTAADIDRATRTAAPEPDRTADLGTALTRSGWRPTRTRDPDQQARELARSLSETDRQILARLCRGEPDREIGQALHRSRHTVRRHVARLTQTVGARKRTELAAWAGRIGLDRQTA